jgi:hypothetical protein
MSVKIFFSAIFLFFISVNNAFAYLDPGTGSIILQTIIAVLAGISAWITIFWAKIKNFFKKLLKKKNKKTT